MFLGMTDVGFRALASAGCGEKLTSLTLRSACVLWWECVVVCLRPQVRFSLPQGTRASPATILPLRWAFPRSSTENHRRQSIACGSCDVPRFSFCNGKRRRQRQCASGTRSTSSHLFPLLPAPPPFHHGFFLLPPLPVFFLPQGRGRTAGPVGIRLVAQGARGGGIWSCVF